MKRTRKNETTLWKHIRPNLLGRRWTRLESRGTTSGPGDAFGFYGGQTQWVELKCGLPKIESLRPSQYEFILECLKSKVPVWCCFSHLGRVVWFSGLPTGEPQTPPFFRVA